MGYVTPFGQVIRRQSQVMMLIEKQKYCFLQHPQHDFVGLPEFDWHYDHDLSNHQN